MSEEDPREPRGTGTRLSATQIHDNILGPAEAELRRSGWSLFWSALASGLLIGFSFVMQAYVLSRSAMRLGPPLAALAYPLGFMLVIVSRSELFTENTLEPVIPLLNHPDRATFLKTLRLWGLLLLGNLLGSLLFALALARTPAVPAELGRFLDFLSAKSTEGSFGQVLYGAIFAGWLIALLTWLLAATRSTGAQLALIWLCTVPIAALGFRHSILGSTEAFYRALRGLCGWGDLFVRFLPAAVLGNALGGVVLVALLNYGQVASELGRRPRAPPPG